MQCDVVLIYKRSTADSEIEVAENQVSLFKKYNGRPFGNGRTTTCYALQMGSEESRDTSTKIEPARAREGVTLSTSVPDLKGKGTVGIYILCHTADLRATAASVAKQIYKEVIEDKNANVRKINIACCNAANDGKGVKGIIRTFCDGLEAVEKDLTTSLIDGLMVCGFAKSVTTFDVDPSFMKGGTSVDLYSNAQALRNDATGPGQTVRTVVQHHDKKNTISFTHEKVDDIVELNMLQKLDDLLQRQVRICWDKDKDKIGKNLKTMTGKDCGAIMQMSLDAVLNHTAADLAAMVGHKKVASFVTSFRQVLAKDLYDAALKQPSLNGNDVLDVRQSFEAYLKMKRVLKYSFAAHKFTETTLDDYTDNQGLGNVLAFVQKGGTSFAAEFSP